VKAFKWYHELEEIMGDKPNIGRPIAPVDSLDPGPQSKRKGRADSTSSSSPCPKQRRRNKGKGKAQVESPSSPDPSELSEEERHEMEVEAARCRRNESTGLAGRANFSPAGPPTDDDDEEPVPPAAATARQKRRKILKKLAQTVKARGSTRKANPAVTAANEKMDALINMNERIQKEKIKSEERTEAKRIKADAQRAKEREKHTEETVREVGGIIKDVIQTVSSMYFKSQAVQPAPTTQRLSSPRWSPSPSS
jgi:hypothetical protein